MTLWLVGQTIIVGLLIGSIYALVACGFTLIFGVVRVLNFAHGDLTMLAMYGTYFIVNKLGVNPYFSLLIMMPLGFLVGQFLYQTMIKNAIDAPFSMKPILVTVGIGLIIQNGAMSLFGVNPRVILWPYSISVLQIGTIYINLSRFVAFFISLLVFLFFYWIFRYTDLGRAIRAVAEDPIAAAIVGLNVNKTMGIAFGLGITCVAVAGPILSVIYPFTPTFGNFFMLNALVVVLMGGLGSFPGSLVSGLILGLADAFGAMIFPGTSAPLLGYLLLIVILIFRPDGLMGVK